MLTASGSAQRCAQEENFIVIVTECADVEGGWGCVQEGSPNWWRTGFLETPLRLISSSSSTLSGSQLFTIIIEMSSETLARSTRARMISVMARVPRLLHKVHIALWPAPIPGPTYVGFSNNFQPPPALMLQIQNMHAMPLAPFTSPYHIIHSPTNDFSNNTNSHQTELNYKMILGLLQGNARHGLIL